MSYSFCSWCIWTKLERWVNLSFYLFVSGLREVKISKISMCYPRDLGTFPRSFRERGAVIQCVWGVCRWGWCYSGCWVWDIRLVSGKWNVFRVIQKLYGRVHKILRLPQLLVELWVPNHGYFQSAVSQSVVVTAGSQTVVITAGSQSGGSQFEFYR